MTCDAAPTPHTTSLPPGYRIEIDASGPIIEVRILADSGDLAASGFAAEWDGVFVYDRIITDAAHRRLGLGRIVMAALSGERRSRHSRQILVATDEGRALYMALGWTVQMPFSSAGLPDDDMS
ncbi:GNAT family N-acetyltransferase [Sphingomonas sp. UYAg733]